MNKRKIGQEQEQFAATYLESQGYQILERNYWCPVGEIDLIGYHRGYLVFIEVKFRKTLGKGYPEEAVTLAKQRRISKTALWYMTCRNISMDVPCRFDVVSVMPDEITVYEDAFPFCV